MRRRRKLNRHPHPNPSPIKGEGLKLSSPKVVRPYFEARFPASAVDKCMYIGMRVPASLLEAVKARASARGIPYQRLIREALEAAIASRK